MKKIITIFVAALAFLLSSAWFSSCSKISSSSLSGTTWVASEKTEYVTIAYTLIFLSESAFSITINTNDDNRSDTLNGTYNVNGNSITLIISFQTTAGTRSQSLTGTISGNTMILSDPEGDTMLFTKL